MASASSPVGSPSKKKVADHHDNLFAPDDDNFSDPSDNEEVAMDNLNHKVCEPVPLYVLTSEFCIL